jgi:hypothetical protein
MTKHSPMTRRDPRHKLRPGSGFVEFMDPDDAQRRVSGTLTLVSASGLAFEVDRVVPNLRAGTWLRDAKMLVGNCELRGDIAVRNARPLEKSGMGVGGLFYPSSPTEEDRFLVLIASLESARPE